MNRIIIKTKINTTNKKNTNYFFNNYILSNSIRERIMNITKQKSETLQSLTF